MAATASDQRDTDTLDSGQGFSSEAGPSGRPFEGNPPDFCPRLRTSLVNQDSILAEEAQSAGALTLGSMGSRNPSQQRSPLHSSSGTGASSSEAFLGRGDSSASGAAMPDVGGASARSSSGLRDAPAGESAENSSSGSGTMRSHSRKFQVMHSTAMGRKRPPWHIDLTEVEVGDLIASGSFGSVHKGWYHGRTVAIKLLHIPESSRDKEKRAILHAFKQEVTVWHSLHHPNIVEFIGASMEAKQWAIVTEFIPGGSLKSFTAQRQGKRLPMQQAVNMALDVARGMAYLHNKDILHRDLKSANLLIDPTYRVKVADFGLARQEAADPGDMTCETGTIRWMAPEVIDHRPYTRKVDVYSFSIVAWELFTMKLPFEGFSFVQLAHAVVASNARPPTTGIPKPLADILERCWDPMPERRPDFNTVVKWLEDVLDEGVSDLKDAKTSGCGSCTLL